MHHGIAPSLPGFLDYLIVVISVIVLLVALLLFIRGFARPGEKEADHIKRKILDDHIPPPGDNE